MRQKNRRRISVLMASVMMIFGAAAPVKAAAPKVEVDETMYEMCIRDRNYFQ